MPEKIIKNSPLLRMESYLLSGGGSALSARSNRLGYVSSGSFRTDRVRTAIEKEYHKNALEEAIKKIRIRG